MQLLEVRRLFVQRSGRYDLVSNLTTFTPDNGANTFINQGIRYLDNRYQTPDSVASRVVSLTPGSPVVQVPDLRADHKVYYDNGEGEGVGLSKLTLHELQSEYGYGVSTAAIDKGEPVHYALAVRRGIGSFGEADDDLRLVILPPVEGNTSITVEGLYYSAQLTADDDENWWTIAHSGLVIESALMHLERFYRNFQGVADHRSIIEDDLLRIDANVIESEYYEVLTMRDSW